MKWSDQIWRNEIPVFSGHVCFLTIGFGPGICSWAAPFDIDLRKNAALIRDMLGLANKRMFPLFLQSQNCCAQDKMADASTVSEDDGKPLIGPSPSWEWSISNFPCSLARNTSHSAENLAFHSLNRWNLSAGFEGFHLTFKCLNPFLQIFDLPFAQ